MIESVPERLGVGLLINSIYSLLRGRAWKEADEPKFGEATQDCPNAALSDKGLA